MATATNPSLGNLEDLPAEIRDAIYELAIDSSAEDTNLLGRCSPYTALAFVSRQVSSEAIGLVTKQHNSLAPTCQHSSFNWTIPKDGLKEEFEKFQASTSVTSHRLNVFPFTVTFITGHLNKHAPTSVTFEIDLPNARSCMFVEIGFRTSRREGCKVVSCEGGHEYVKRHILPEVTRKIMNLQRWAEDQTGFDQKVIEDYLFESAKILRWNSLAADALIRCTRKKLRKSNEKWEKKRQQEVERNKKANVQGRRVRANMRRRSLHLFDNCDGYRYINCSRTTTTTFYLRLGSKKAGSYFRNSCAQRFVMRWHGTGLRRHRKT